MSGGKKHRWSQPDRPSPNRTLRYCLNRCGVMKISRHDPAHDPPHWTEFYCGSDKVPGNVGTPACRPIGALLALDEARE